MMQDSQGNMDEIIRRGGTNNDVVFGDVNPNGGDLHLRADGNTNFSVLSNRASRFWPVTGSAPATCSSSIRGSTYYDGDDDKLKVCAKNLFGSFDWINLH